jgi:hypothetical protein
MQNGKNLLKNKPLTRTNQEVFSAKIDSKLDQLIPIFMFRGATPQKAGHGGLTLFVYPILVPARPG